MEKNRLEETLDSPEIYKKNCCKPKKIKHKTEHNSSFDKNSLGFRFRIFRCKDHFKFQKNNKKR